MNWAAIARKDFRDAVRSKTVWALLAAFVALFVLGVVVEGRGATRSEFVERTLTNVLPVLPIVGVVLGYKSVIHERESGTLLLSLSLPQSRRDLVVGKLVGRSLVLSLPVIAGLIAAGALAAVRYGTVAPARYLAFVGLTVLYGVSFLSIALACSMSTTRGRRVTAGAFGAYLVLALFWVELVELLVLVVFRFRVDALVVLPDWAQFLQVASPGEAYAHVVIRLFGLDGWGVHAAPHTPWYVNAWTALALLVAWIAVPVALGYRRFRRADL